MINSGQISHMAPTLSMMSRSQFEEIHAATLEVLRRTGVRVLVPEVQELLRKAGCWVSGEIVRIPAFLIERAIRNTPKSVVLCNRDGEPAMFLEGRKAYYGTGSDTPYVIDAETGQRRTAVLGDVENVARLVDALSHISFVMCMGIASDVTETISDLYHFRAMVANTRKPIVFTSWSRANLEAIVEMAEVVADGPEALQRNPFCALYAEPIAPLVHGEEACEKLLYICQKGIPVVYTPGLITGASSPVTLAGALVQANAELLSGILICQTIREGAPVIAGAGGMMAMDMGTMVASYGAPEFMLDWAALCDMAHFYGLPSFGFAGVSDAKAFDQQAAAEGAVWVMLSALAGGNLNHDVGYIESGLTTSYEMLVTMDDIIGLTQRFMGGISVTTETLGLDVIDSVGPGGHFLTDDHTLRHFKENWYPKLMERGDRQSWIEGGELSLGERANRRVQALLGTHRPPPLDRAALSALDSVIERSCRRAG